jgi:hypothetical protein
VYEVYCRGDSILRACIDEGAEVTGTQSLAPTDGIYVYGEVTNGATAANRQLISDFVGVLHPR